MKIEVILDEVSDMVESFRQQDLTSVEYIQN